MFSLHPKGIGQLVPSCPDLFKLNPVRWFWEKMSKDDEKGVTSPTLLFFLAILIGVVAFFFLNLEGRYAFFGILILLTPFLALLSGQWKAFFLFLLILGIPVQLKKTLYGYSLTHICGPGGFDLLLADGAFLALYMHWLYKIAIQKQERVFHISKMDFLFLLFMMINGFSILESVDLTLSLIDLIRILKVGFIYFYLANNILTEREFRLVLYALFLGVLIQSSVSIAQYGLGRPLGLYLLGEQQKFGTIELDGISLLQGPSGIMQGANTSALYFVSLLPYIFAAQFWMKRREMKVLIFCLFTMGIFSLIITNSRGGWVGFLFSFPVLLYLSIKRGFITYRKHFPIVVMIGLVFVAVLLYSSPKILDRLFRTPSVPIYTRTFLNRLAIEMMNTHPILGVGVNNFAESGQSVIRDIPDPQNIFQYVVENPVVHNVYLLIGAETGLLGLIVFLLILLLLLKKSWSLVQSDEPFVSCFGIASLCFLLGLVMTEMFDFSYRLDQLFYLFWTLAGLIVALSRLEELGKEPAPVRMINE